MRQLLSHFQQTRQALPARAREYRRARPRVATITPVWGQNPHELWVACQGRARRPASSRYGERLLTDPDDRLCNPLLGEPAANVGEDARRPALASAGACSRDTSYRRSAGRFGSARAPIARRAEPCSARQVRRSASDISLMGGIGPRGPLSRLRQTDTGGARVRTIAVCGARLSRLRGRAV